MHGTGLMISDITSLVAKCITSSRTSDSSFGTTDDIINTGPNLCGLADAINGHNGVTWVWCKGSFLVVLVCFEAIPHNNFVVVGALNKSRSDLFGWWSEHCVIALLCDRIDATTRYASHDLIIRHFKHNVEMGHQTLTNHELTLLPSTAHAVKDIPIGGNLRILIHSRLDHCLNHVVRNQTPGVHEALGLFTDLCSSLNLCAKGIACGELDHAVFLADVGTLGAFASSGRGIDAQPERSTVDVTDGLHLLRSNTKGLTEILESFHVRAVEQVSHSTVGLVGRRSRRSLLLATHGSETSQHGYTSNPSKHDVLVLGEKLADCCLSHVKL